MIPLTKLDVSRAALCLLAALALSSEARAQALSGGQTAPPSSAEDAADPDEPSDRPRVQPGEQARQWLHQQATKQQASRIRQTQGGAVTGHIYTRYLKSYERPRELKESAGTSPF